MTEQDTFNVLTRINPFQALYLLLGNQTGIWLKDFKQQPYQKMVNGIIIKPYWDENLDFTKLKFTGWTPESLFEELLK